jgi:DNA-binding PadR family transcriptional regulator
MDANIKRDILRITILELLTKGSVHYTDLDKKTCATSYPFATTNTFKSQLHYLLRNNYIEKPSRGVYKISDKGKKYLDLFTF